MTAAVRKLAPSRPAAAYRDLSCARYDPAGCAAMILRAPLTPTQAEVVRPAFAPPYAARVTADDGIDATFLTIVQFVFCLNCPDGWDHLDLVIDDEALLARLAEPESDPIAERIATELQTPEGTGPVAEPDHPAGRPIDGGDGPPRSA